MCSPGPGLVSQKLPSFRGFHQLIPIIGVFAESCRLNRLAEFYILRSLNGVPRLKSGRWARDSKWLKVLVFLRVLVGSAERRLLNVPLVG